MHLRNNYGPLEMSRIDRATQAGASNKGRRASPAPRGIFSNTYDASTGLRRPRNTLSQVVRKASFLTHDAMEYVLFVCNV